MDGYRSIIHSSHLSTLISYRHGSVARMSWKWPKSVVMQLSLVSMTHQMGCLTNQFMDYSPNLSDWCNLIKWMNKRKRKRGGRERERQLVNHIHYRAIKSNMNVTVLIFGREKIFYPSFWSKAENLYWTWYLSADCARQWNAHCHAFTCSPGHGSYSGLSQYDSKLWICYSNQHISIH